MRTQLEFDFSFCFFSKKFFSAPRGAKESMFTSSSEGWVASFCSKNGVFPGLERHQQVSSSDLSAGSFLSGSQILSWKETWRMQNAFKKAGQ